MLKNLINLIFQILIFLININSNFFLTKIIIKLKMLSINNFLSYLDSNNIRVFQRLYFYQVILKIIKSLIYHNHFNKDYVYLNNLFL